MKCGKSVGRTIGTYIVGGMPDHSEAAGKCKRDENIIFGSPNRPRFQ